MQGNALPRKLVLPTLPSAAEPLRLGSVVTVEDQEVEDVAEGEKRTSNKSKQKKIGLESIPVENDLYAFDRTWT